MMKFGVLLVLMVMLGSSISSFSVQQSDAASSVNAVQPTTCPGFMPSRLTIGEQGRVTPGDANNWRADPALDAQQIGLLVGGAVFEVLDGPTCGDNGAWWQVEHRGEVGWTLEGRNSTYWLEPFVTQPELPVPYPLLFTRRDRNGTSYDLYLQNFSPPQDPQRLTYHVGAEVDGVWSPDGSQIAYLSIFGGLNAHLMVMNADGSNARQITSTPLPYDALAWSPDSRQIALGVSIVGGDLTIITLETGEIAQVTTIGYRPSVVQWSPYSGRLYFIGDRDPGLDINPLDRWLFWLPTDARMATSATPFLPLSDGEITDFAISPNGNEIAVVRDNRLILYDNDGNVVNNLFAPNTDRIASTMHSLAWTPDNRGLVFYEGGAGGTPVWRYILSQDGTRIARTEVDPNRYGLSWRNALITPTIPSREPVDGACPGFLPSRLSIGGVARVTPGDPNNLRAEPSTDAEFLGTVDSSAILSVLQGPVCGENGAWWVVRVPDPGGIAEGTEAWTLEGQGDTYWMEPG
ncbi:hypothetical protein HC928_03535 [bacterium]|nr:hypothetical protein [bacterium]